jgi:hypothetical protein
MACGFRQNVRKLSWDGSGKFKIFAATLLSEGFDTLLLATVVNDLSAGTGLYLACSFGQIDEVDLRFLVLAERLHLLIISFASCKWYDVPGGLGHLEMQLICQVDEILFVLVGGELLEEFGWVDAPLHATLLGFGGTWVVYHHFNDYIL